MMKPFSNTHIESITSNGVKAVIFVTTQDGKPPTDAQVNEVIAALVQRRQELEEAGHGKTDAA